MPRVLCLFAVFVVVLVSGCDPTASRRVNRELDRSMPPRFLWAWERKEDLRFIDPKRFGVAFHAQTLKLSGDDVGFNPRRQPLDVPENTYLIAVTRIETQKRADRRPALDEAQRRKTVERTAATLGLPNVRAIQIDFDAAVSERGFYRMLMNDLKAAIPSTVPLTMTALASWCVNDNWFNDLPVDEAVPMAFVMGADSETVKDYLRKGNDWREPLCRGSYGFAVEEPIIAELDPKRRIFYFKSSAWQPSDLEQLK